MSNILLISIKPKFIHKILKGRKSIELRKSLPQKVQINDFVILYSTNPEKAVVGFCRINKFHIDSPKSLWSSLSNKFGISETEYFSYFKNQRTAIGIELKDVEELKYHVSLDAIKCKIPKFSPPQSYKYIDTISLANTFHQELEKNKIKMR